MLAVLLLSQMNMRRKSLRRLVKPMKPIKENYEEEDTKVIYCRTCLSTENLVPIFESKESEKRRSREFLILTGLKIKKNDGLSQKICKGCIDTIQTALKFRKTSRKSEKMLLKMRKDGRKYVKKEHNVRKTRKLMKVQNEKSANYNEDYHFDLMGDDYQMDYDFPVQEDVQSLETKQPKAARTDKKIPITIPNASSYKCHTCNKEFRMKATYKAHMRFHTHYCVCESCGKRCRNFNQLQEHKRARHGLGRIHKCAYCDYSPATKEALTIHERRHTGERPYVCDHCGATFHRRSNLVQHIAIHLPEKNFQCDMCPKRLKSRKFLQIHKHNAHTGKRYGYLCSVCEHRFEKPNKVRAHARRVHGLPDEQLGPIVRVQL